MKHAGRSFNKQEDENRLLASIIESSDIIMYSLDKKGSIQTWNFAAEQLLGFTKSDIIGSNIKKLLRSEEKEDIAKSLKKVFQGEVVRSIEAVHYTKDKKMIPMGLKISPIRVSEGSIIGASITARDLRREINFREKEQFLLKVSQSLNSSLDYNHTLTSLAKLLVPRFADWCAIHTIQPETNTIQLALTYGGGSKDIWIHKWEEHQIKKAKYVEIGADMLIKSKRSFMYSPLPGYSKNAHFQEQRYNKLTKKLGITSVIVVPLLSRGTIIGTITLVSKYKKKQFEKEDFELAEEIGRRAGPALDNATLFENAQKEIQERKRIANELQKSRNQLRIILENISDGITVQDENGKSIFVNDAIAKTSGYTSSKDMIENPKDWELRFTLYDEQGNVLTREDIPTARVRNGERFAQRNVRYVDKKTGESYWSHIKAQGVYEDSGKLQYIVTVVHDVTEMQEQEARKDEFISMASHELKTPLTSLVVYLHLLKLKIKDSENNELLSKIERQTDKLNKLVTELLDISKIQSGRLDYTMEQFELNEVVRDVTQVVQGITSKHKIVVSGDRDLHVYGDKNRINQVLTNLLINAIKYSPEGGSISVDTKKKGTFAQVKVTDHGIGISIKDQQKIFEKLYQAGNPREKTFPGLGIGLYIASNIVKSHGGTIEVKSQKGKGATFIFTVPLRKHV